jgi:hypothetical protein
VRLQLGDDGKQLCRIGGQVEARALPAETRRHDEVVAGVQAGRELDRHQLVLRRVSAAVEEDLPATSAHSITVCTPGAAVRVKVTGRDFPVLMPGTVGDWTVAPSTWTEVVEPFAGPNGLRRRGMSDGSRGR